MRAGLPLLGARPSSIYLLPSSSSFSFSIQCYGSFVSFSALLESRLHYRVFSVSPPHSHLQTHIETGKSIALIHYILDQEKKKKNTKTKTIVLPDFSLLSFLMLAIPILYSLFLLLLMQHIPHILHILGVLISTPLFCCSPF